MKFPQHHMMAVLLLLLASPASAHHSGAMFDRTKEAVLVGTIKELGWVNPHSFIRVLVPDASGQTKEWVVELGPPNSLVRKGWTRSSLKPGEGVTMRVYPLKNGSSGGTFIGVTLASGKKLGD